MDGPLPTVTVFQFEVFDAQRRCWVTATKLGTPEAIARLGGIPIRSSAMVVDISKVDGHGMVEMHPHVLDGEG